MALTAADIKFYAATTNTDTPDGGGPRSSTLVQDGVANATFNATTSADRLAGRVAARKIFAGPLSANTDTLLSAAVLVDELTGSGDVEAAVWAYGSETTRRAEAVNALRTGEAKAYGLLRTNTATPLGATALSVERTDIALAPRKITSTATGGRAATETAMVYYPSGQTRTYSAGNPFSGQLTRWSLGDSFVLSLAAASVLPNSLTGTVNGAAVSQTILSDYDGGFINDVSSTAAPAVDYELAVWATLPLQRQRTTVAASNASATYVLAIPAGTVPGSESVVWTRGATATTYRAMTNGASMACVRSHAGQPIIEVPGGLTIFAVVDRTAGTISVQLSQSAAAGDTLDVHYSTATAALVPFSNVSGSGTLVAGQVTVATTVNYGMDSAVFRIGTDFFGVVGTEVRNLSGAQVGTFDQTTGVLTMPGKTGTIDFWAAVSSDRRATVSTVSARLVGAGTAPLQIAATTTAGAAVSATADGAGNFNSGGVTGKFTASTGQLALQFSPAVRWNSITYIGAVQAETLLVSAAGAVVGAKVSAIRAGDMCTLWHDSDAAPTTASVGAALSAGRTDLHEIAIIGNDGAEITRVLADGPASTLGTADLLAGTFTPSTVAGWSQPVTVRSRIAQQVIADAVDTANLQVTLAAPVTRAFPLGSRLSPHLPLGDIAARVVNDFSQQAWTRQWSSTVIGNPVSEMYAGVPGVTNGGADTDRYAVVWSDAVTFLVYSELRGLVGTGTKTANYSPLNPNTGVPLFTLLSAAWAADILVSSVYRFDVVSAFPAFWAIRTTNIAAGTGAGAVAFALEGGANA
jgi:hypothetical protein